MTTEVKNEVAPLPGTPEYDAAMIAKAEGIVIQKGGQAVVVEKKTEDKSAVPPKPDYVPAKFYNAETGVVDYEALAKSYGELERTRQAKPAEQAQAPVNPVTALVKEAEAAVAATTDEASKASAQARLDALKAAETAAAPKAPTEAQLSSIPEATLSKANDEYVADGKLSDETYAALAKHGLSKDYVDSYVDGLSARAELFTSKVHGEAGGEDQYKAMTAWALTNYTDAQVTAFNNAVTSGDVAAAQAAVKSLKDVYVAANGNEPGTRIENNSGGGGAVPGHFKSEHELTTAMKDPRYKLDAAYRAEVAQKIAGSSRLNINLGIYG